MSKIAIVLFNVYNDNPITQQQVTVALPQADAAAVLAETTFDSTALGEESVALVPRNGGRINFSQVQSAAEAIAARVKPQSFDKVYVAGRAPLPAFAALGYALTASTKVVFVHFDYSGEHHELMPLYGATTPLATNLSDDVPGSPSLSDGNVAIVWSSMQEGHNSRVVDTNVADFVKETVGGALAAVVHMDLPAFSAENSAALAEHVFLSIRNKLHHAFLRRTGWTMILEGPAPLAFALRRALDPNITPRPANVPFFVQGQGYQPGVVLGGSAVNGEPDWGETQHERQLLLRDIADHVRRFKENIDRNQEIVEQLLPAFVRDCDLLSKIKSMEVSLEEKASAEFTLDAHERTVTFNRGLLRALVENVEADDRKDIALLIFVHEMYHTSQGLLTSNYHGIGRAGFALEEVDFWADVVAIGLLTTLDVALGGQKAVHDLPGVAARWVGLALKGMEAFDRIGSHEGHMNPFPERRLRRYLMWYLQEARMRTLSTSSRNADAACMAMWTMLRVRIFIEIAPLRTFLSAQFDKIIAEHNVCLSATAVFVVVNRRLVRIPQSPSLSIENLVNDIRTFNSDSVRNRIKVVRDEVERHETLAGHKRAHE